MTRSRRAALLPLLPALALTLLLGACSDDPLEDMAVEETVESGQEVSTDLVAFELPDGWTVLDTAAMRERAGSEDNPLLEDLSERSGLGAEELAAQLDSMELYAAAPGGAVEGLLTNVNVIEQPMPPGGMPSPEAMRPELMMFADEVGDIATLDNPDGLDGLRAAYRVESGGITVNGAQLYVEVEDSVVIITISATEADTSAEVADLVEETLSPA